MKLVKMLGVLSLALAATVSSSFGDTTGKNHFETKVTYGPATVISAGPPQILQRQKTTKIICEGCNTVQDWIPWYCDCVDSTDSTYQTGVLNCSGTIVCISDEALIPVPRPPSLHTVNGSFCWCDQDCEIDWEDV